MAINELRQVTVHEIGDLKEGTTNDREWKLRGVVVEEQRVVGDKTYTDFLDVTCFGQAVDGLADVSVGDTVDVNYTVSSKRRTSAAGNEYWGTSAKCISLKVVGEQKAQVPDGTKDPNDWTEQGKKQDQDEPTDLPF